MNTVLTRDHIKALRDADSVCFRSNGKTTIEAGKKFRHGLYGEIDHTLYIEVHQRDSNSGNAFDSLLFARYDHCWQTIVACLRPGDTLHLQWAKDDATNNYCEVAGLHSDRLYLHVLRKEKRLTFFVSQSVCDDNSARMVRD